MVFFLSIFNCNFQNTPLIVTSDFINKVLLLLLLQKKKKKKKWCFQLGKVSKLGVFKIETLLYL
jgi:hypothetical protein